MPKDDYTIRFIPVRGRFKGKRIELAPQERLGQCDDTLVTDFMKRILRTTSFLITDESSLWDFRTRKKPVFDRIQKIYGVDVSDIEDGNLTKIF